MVTIVETEYEDNLVWYEQVIQTKYMLLNLLSILGSKWFNDILVKLKQAD